MIVLDASTAIDLLLNRRPAAQRIADRIAAEAPAIAAPHLLDAEVGQVLRRFVLTGEVSARRALDALDDFAVLPIVRYPHGPILKLAFALRENTTFCDALYLALAEAMDATLVTCDRRLAGIPGAGAQVDIMNSGATPCRICEAGRDGASLAATMTAFGAERTGIGQ